MKYIPLIALSLAATVPIVSGYAITGDSVNCRSGPGTSYSVVKTYSKGQDVSITCQAPGTDINGDNLWDKTSDGCYVADYYVSTGTTGYVTSKCGAGSGGYPITGDSVNCRSGPGTSYSVVKTYSKGQDVSITCQAPGTDINGDNLWDKTSDGCYVADYYVSTGTTGYVTSECGGGGGSGGNLPGLDATQSSHARAIIAEAKRENLGHQGCLAAITTAITESNILIYANRNVPASFNYPYDDVGHDYDSVGIFQQRVKYYPDIAADMDPAQSAGQFFAVMVKVSGWQTMDIGELCQTVQVSAFPAAYEPNVPAAQAICSAEGY
ncbi:hypothetical protein V1517DRAFT_28082 [Lipomyces orientalis]|uniref:Uncharacterized protein n=1 Tax=Lipomyces orientalis TaxID=1233043 RepID=A0ACC3TFA6_9ASCO